MSQNDLVNLDRRLCFVMENTLSITIFLEKSYEARETRFIFQSKTSPLDSGNPRLLPLAPVLRR